MSFALAGAAGAGAGANTTGLGKSKGVVVGKGKGSRVVAGAAGGRRSLVASAAPGSQDAYNNAMSEYSKTPFEYRHELGLCKLHQKQ